MKFSDKVSIVSLASLAAAKSPEDFIKSLLKITELSFLQPEALQKLGQPPAALVSAILNTGNLSAGARNLAEPAQTDYTNLNRIRNYGCWCNFDNYRNGKGQPLDHYDSACKRLHDNYIDEIMII